MIKIVDVLDPITEEGIFQAILRLFPTTFTWLDSTIASRLDMEYYLGHSAEKSISRLYERLIEREEANDIASSLDAITGMIVGQFKDNWNKIYEAYNIDYEPLENYNMVENEGVNSKVTNKVTTDGSTFGFNSSEAVPNSKVENESSTEGLAKDNYRDLTRSGNIGVTTSQQMLESEIKLRQFNFIQQVMNDIDSVMCLKIY